MVFFASCVGYALLWWVIMLYVLELFVYFSGYEIIAEIYRTSKKKQQNPPQFARNTTASNVVTNHIKHDNPPE